MITAVADNLANLSQPKGQPDNFRCLSWKGRQSGTWNALIAYDMATKHYKTVTAANSEVLPTPKEGAQSVRPPSAADRVLRLIQTRTHPAGALYADLRKNVKVKSEKVDSALKALEAAGTVRKSRDGRSFRYAMA